MKTEPVPASPDQSRYLYSGRNRTGRHQDKPAAGVLDLVLQENRNLKTNVGQEPGGSDPGGSDPFTDPGGSDPVLTRVCTSCRKVSSVCLSSWNSPSDNLE